MLSESLSTVKIQVSQMKRHLVRLVLYFLQPLLLFMSCFLRNWTSLWTRSRARA